LEAILENERREIERQRQQLFLDRLSLQKLIVSGAGTQQQQQPSPQTMKFVTAEEQQAQLNNRSPLRTGGGHFTSI
jgi:hypothetical protein